MSAIERGNISQYFIAEPIQLSDSGDENLLIRGQGKMAGADNDWYWIIASYKHHPRLILFVGCTSLEIQSKKMDGYNDILAVWQSANSVKNKLFRFDGMTYRVSINRWRDVKP
jgi:hypothetical protein